MALPEASAPRITPQGEAHLRRQIAQLRLGSPRQELLDATAERGEERESGVEEVRVRLGDIQRRVQEILRILGDAVIEPIEDQTAVVAIGSTVLLQVAGEPQPRRYIIGGHGESDPSSRIVAYDSDFAQPLMDEGVGAKLSIISSGKLVDASIVEIRSPFEDYAALHMARGYQPKVKV